MPQTPPDTWPHGGLAPAPAGAVPPVAPRRATQRTLREPVGPATPDASLRVAPLALWALVVSAVVLALVLVAVGYGMGRATRVAPVAVECRCPR